MRILDVIMENNNPLSFLNTSIGAASSVNERNADGGQTMYIKQQLARHKLVTAIRNGQFVLGNMAWTVPIDQTWTPQLNQAITAWKRSINLQMTGNERGPLDVNPTAPGITRADIQFLVNTQLGSDGLIDAAQDGGARYTPGDQPGSAAGFTYTPGVIPGTRQQVEADPTTQTLYNAVGESAWYRIAAEIVEDQQSTDTQSWLATTPATERHNRIKSQKIQTFDRNRTAQVSGQWLSNIATQARRAMATYADGTQQAIDVTSVLGPSPLAPDIFDYYAEMATKLWQKDRQNNAQARQDAQTATQSPVSGVVLDEATLRAMAAQLNSAFRNDLAAAVLPGGRTFFNDVEAIQSILSRLRTAADFDNLSQIYAQLHNNEILHERLWEELEKDDYMNVVVPKLLAIRRIAPRIIHTSINFGDAEEIRVEYNGKRYRVQQATGPSGQPVIEGYNRPNDYNAIIIDEILRAAVSASGGALPDFDTPVSDQAKAEAQIAFINTIQNTYPEMVPFYVKAEPFSNASVDIGGARLRSIIDNTARMGGDQAAMAIYITQEIVSDRDWLIGTDDTDPAANIRFDERYMPEGIRGRDFPAVSADDDVELNANEEEIFENLKSPQAGVVRAAVDALLQSDDPEQMWENIYREAAPGLWLDKANNMGNGRTSIEEFLTGRDDGTPIVRIARSIGLPIAAPRVAAEMFYDAGRGKTFGTDEETIDALIAQIRNRYDYELIDERYRQLPKVDDSLIDDLASEQFQGIWGGGWYGRLAEIIGDDRRLELLRAELDRRVIDALEDVERSPGSDTIEDLRRVMRRAEITQDQMSIILERLQDIAEGMTESPAKLLVTNLINELSGDESPSQSTPEIPDYFSP